MPRRNDPEILAALEAARVSSTGSEYWRRVLGELEAWAAGKTPRAYRNLGGWLQLGPVERILLGRAEDARAAGDLERAGRNYTRLVQRGTRPRAGWLVLHESGAYTTRIRLATVTRAGNRGAVYGRLRYKTREPGAERQLSLALPEDVRNTTKTELLIY